MIPIADIICECDTCGWDVMVNITNTEYELASMLIMNLTGSIQRGFVVLPGHTCIGHHVVYQSGRFDILIKDE